MVCGYLCGILYSMHTDVGSSVLMPFKSKIKKRQYMREYMRDLRLKRRLLDPQTAHNRLIPSIWWDKPDIDVERE